MPGDEEFALALYRELRTRGHTEDGRLCEALGLDHDQTQRGLRRLRELGLVQDADGGVLATVEPDTALMRTLDAYRANAAEQARMEQLTRSLMTVYRPAAAREASQVEVDYIRDRRRKDRTLLDLDSTAQESSDAIHPGPMPPMSVLEQSLRADESIVRRGVRVRTIYAQSVLQTPRHARYLRSLADIGAEVRLVDHAPYDLLIYDRLVVCMPADPDNPPQAMIVVRGSALVKIHVAMYEDYWLRSVPFEQGAHPGSGAGESAELSPQERVIIRLMADGLSDDQIARKTGVHRRTVQRAVAKVMKRLNAASRFEAGIKLAQDSEFARALRPPAG